MNGKKVTQLRRLVTKAMAGGKLPGLNKQGWRRLKDEYSKRHAMTVAEVEEFILSLTHEDLRRMMRGMTEEQQHAFVKSITERQMPQCSS